MTADRTSSRTSRASLVRRRLGWTAAAVVALLLAILLSLAVGSRQIAPSAVLDALLHGGSSDAADVVRSLRLPRTVVGVLVGAALAMAGTWCALPDPQPQPPQLRPIAPSPDPPVSWPRPQVGARSTPLSPADATRPGPGEPGPGWAEPGRAVLSRGLGCVRLC